MRLRPKNWDSFQHYKDRRPAWIKLHHTLVDDVNFHSLKGEDAKYLVLIWLIASEDFGYLPANPELAFRLRISTKQLEQLLARLQAWIVYDASKTLAEPEPVAIPEKEIEEEIDTEEEKEIETDPRKRVPFVIPIWIIPETWRAYEEMRRKMRKPMTDRARQLIVGRLQKFRDEGWNADELLNRSIENGWQSVWPPEERNGNQKRNSGDGGDAGGEDGPDLYAALYGKAEQGKPV